MNTKPTIGQTITVRGIQCKIIKVRPFGTIDVESLDGAKHWRLSGLSFL